MQSRYLILIISVLNIQVLVRLIADYQIKLHAPLIGLVNRQIF